MYRLNSYHSVSGYASGWFLLKFVGLLCDSCTALRRREFSWRKLTTSQDGGYVYSYLSKLRIYSNALYKNHSEILI